MSRSATIPVRRGGGLEVRMGDEMVITFPGGKRVDAHYNGFHIETDQSPRYGGEGRAPEPYDLFLASMATCAGIYVLSFCERRGLPTEGLRLVQRWFRDTSGRLERIVLDVEVPEAFPEKYHTAVTLAARQCTVKRTLDDPPNLEVHVVEKGAGEPVPQVDTSRQPANLNANEHKPT